MVSEVWEVVADTLFFIRYSCRSLRNFAKLRGYNSEFPCLKISVVKFIYLVVWVNVTRHCKYHDGAHQLVFNHSMDIKSSVEGTLYREIF